MSTIETTSQTTRKPSRAAIAIVIPTQKKAMKNRAMITPETPEK
jgi:hypothetical protein